MFHSITKISLYVLARNFCEKHDEAPHFQREKLLDSYQSTKNTSFFNLQTRHSSVRTHCHMFVAESATYFGHKRKPCL